MITSMDRDNIKVLPRIGNLDDIIKLEFDEFFEIHKRNIPEVLFSEQKITY